MLQVRGIEMVESFSISLSTHRLTGEEEDDFYRRRKG